MRRTLVLLALALFAVPLGAQPPAPPARRNVLSVNPLGIPAGFYSADYERALGANASGSVGVSYFSLHDEFDDEVSYLSSDLKLRYYPRAALEGFSVGASAGLIRLGSDETTFDGQSTEESESGVTVGTSLDYGWLLGDARRVAVGLGAGLKRVLLFGGEAPDVTTFYPTIRVAVGYAF